MSPPAISVSFRSGSGEVDSRLTCAAANHSTILRSDFVRGSFVEVVANVFSAKQDPSGGCFRALA